MTQPQGNTIEFSNINHYDIDIKPTGVYLTIHTDTVTHTIKANIKPVTASPIQVQKAVSVTPTTVAKKQPEVVAIHKASATNPAYHKPHFNPEQRRWSKLTGDQVAEIKGIWPEILEEYKYVSKAADFLAEIYGCSRGNIELIVRGKSWVDVKPKKK